MVVKGEIFDIDEEMLHDAFISALRRSRLPMNILFARSSLEANAAASPSLQSSASPSEASLLSGCAAGGSPTPSGLSDDYCRCLLRFG